MYRIQSTRRRILAMLLFLALLISVLPTFALRANAAKDPLEKLDAGLIEALENASDSDQIPVRIWLEGFSSSYFDELVLREYGPAPGEGCTAEEANTYLKARREIVRRETVAYNEKFAAEVLPEIPQSDYLYFGKYTSTLIAALNAAQIRAVANDARVSSLNLYYDYECEPEAADEFSAADPDFPEDVEYVDGQVIFSVTSTPETREMTFCSVYCADYESINAQREANGGRGQIAGSPEELIEKLNLGIPIVSAELLNPSVNSDRTETGEYPYTDKYNNVFSADLGDISVRDAVAKLKENPLIRNAQPNYLFEFDDEPGQSLTQEEQICRDYYRFLTQSGRIREIEFWLDPDSPEGDRLYPSDVRIDVDYGEWNGWRVLMMDPRTDEMGMCEAYLRIGNFWFSCCYEVADLMFVAWKDGQVLPVNEAYKQGLLTADDLYGLFRRFYRDRSIPFQDVDPQAWYAEAVNYAYHCSIFNGMALNRFNPSGTMTRAMLVTVLHRQNGMPFAGSSPFTDVPAQSWYTDAVAWAAEKKIVNGVGGGRFAPEAPLTREQLVTILYRMYGAQDDAPALRGYPDAGDVSQWADAAVRWAVAEGILRGVPHSDGRTCLDPGSPVTRAQAATILLRIARSASASAA